jgi:hypothetical protein
MLIFVLGFVIGVGVGLWAMWLPVSAWRPPFLNVLAMYGIPFAVMCAIQIVCFSVHARYRRMGLYIAKYRLMQLAFLAGALAMVLLPVMYYASFPAANAVALWWSFLGCWLVGLLVWTWQSSLWKRFRTMRRAQAAHDADRSVPSACLFCAHTLLNDQDYCPECGRPRVEAPPLFRAAQRLHVWTCLVRRMSS